MTDSPPSKDGDRMPARGYSWPPFEAGNVSAVRHGALSPRLVSEDAAELLIALKSTDAPWLETVDAVLLDAWLHALAATQRLRSWLDDKGLLDEKGQPRAAADLWLKLERRLDRATSRLGFDPLSRAGLARDSAVARHLATDARQQAEDAGRELRLRALGPDDGGTATYDDGGDAA